MAFSEHKINEFTNRIAELADQPNMLPDELKQYFDSSPEELRQALNALCDALTAATAAAGIGFAQTAGVPESTVQAAIENVQAQVTAAIIGSIPSGSIDMDKLAQDVRNRFTSIESSVTSEAGTRASADTNLQNQINTHTTQIAAKCEVYFGSYTGNGASSRLISIGFAPKLLICASSDGQILTGNRILGGIVFPNTTGGIALEGNGFRVQYSSDEYWNNSNGSTYYFIAFK